LNLGTNYASLTLLSEAYATNNKEKIRDILTYYLKVTSLAYLIVGAILIIIAPLVTKNFYHNENIGQLARIIILSNAVNLVFGMYTIVLQVIRKIKNLTTVENINKISLVLIPVVFVLLGYGLNGLVFGYLLANLIFIGVSFWGYKSIVKLLPIFPTWTDILKNWKKVKVGYYFKFGFSIAIDKNISSLYSTLPIFILGIFDLNAVAFFKVANAYASAPLMLINPVSRLLTVHLPKAKANNYKLFKKNFIQSSVGSFLITVVATLVFLLLANTLIPAFYGADYKLAVNLSIPLLIAVAFVALGVGNGSALRTLNLMKKSIIMNTSYLILSAPILFYFISRYSINVSIYFIAAWLPLVSLIFYIFIIKNLNKLIQEEIK
jgi:O-antigen/teichoic acid export membrane protein